MNNEIDENSEIMPTNDENIENERYTAKRNNSVQSKTERNNKNNANNIRNAADVALATKNPYAMAGGAAVKLGDKLTNGKFSENAGKALTTINKFSPGGKKIQQLSNKLSESGTSDKIGKAASLLGNKKGGSKPSAGNTQNQTQGIKNNSTKGTNVFNNIRNNSIKSNKETEESDSVENNNNKINTLFKSSSDSIVKSKIKMFLLKHPTVIFVLVSIALLLLVLFIIISAFTLGDSETGYYDPSCDYTNTNIHYVCSNNSIDETIDISDYVKNVLNGYITKDKTYDDNVIKAAMIVIKTNALTYDSIQETININDCTIPYTNDDNLKISLDELYDSIQEEIFVKNEYEKVEKLSIEDRLEFNNDSLNNFENKLSKGDYTAILLNTYGQDKKIYRLEDYCQYIELDNNSGYWWPMGSKEETGDNIYGGAPSTVYISSYFGMRYIGGAYKNHSGIDISIGNCQSINYPIISTVSGIVASTYNGCETVGSYGNTCGGGFGNHVKIQNSDGILAIYAHMKKDSIKVSQGQTVKQGQLIGYEGSSGSSTGCHLHFELRVNGSAVNPLDYVSTENPRQIEIADDSNNKEETTN